MRNLIGTRLLILGGAVLAALCHTRASADVIEHPAFANWSKFPVGTRVTVRSTTKSKGKVTANVMTTTTLAKKDEKAVVIRKIFRVEGEPEPHPEDGVEATIRRDLIVAAESAAPKAGAAGDKPAKPRETIEILGKKYEAELSESRGATEAGPITTKTWTSVEMPGQVLRSVSEVAAAGKITVDEVVSIEIPGAK